MKHLVVMCRYSKLKAAIRIFLGWQIVCFRIWYFKQHMVLKGVSICRRPTCFRGLFLKFFSKLESLIVLHHNQVVTSFHMNRCIIFEHSGQFWRYPIRRVDRKDTDVEESLVFALAGQILDIRLTQEMELYSGFLQASQKLSITFLGVAVTNITLFYIVQVNFLARLCQWFFKLIDLLLYMVFWSGWFINDFLSLLLFFLLLLFLFVVNALLV